MDDAMVVRAWRERMGFGVGEAAAALGVSRTQWWRYESGASKFPRAKWRELAVRLLSTEDGLK